MEPLIRRRPSALATCALACAFLASGADAQEPLWPMANGSHDVLHSFQNPFFFFSYFHEGVDIRGSLDDVQAVRGGIVRFYDPSYAGGTMTIEVQTPDGVEADSYLHVILDPWIVGETIEAGDIVGQVSDSYFAEAIQDHVHVNRFDGYAGGSGYVTGRTNMLHPLAMYTGAADRDPQTMPAAPQDANEDGTLFHVAPHDDNTQALPYAFGRVDLLLEAADRQTSTLYWSQGLVGAGYWIESQAGGDDVRSALAPYRVVSFDDAWRASHADCDLLVVDALQSSSPYVVEFGTTNTTWTSLATYKLTNTTGTTGSGADIDAAQFWRTDALAGSGSEPNGSDGGVAREIHEARFPDGHYVVHALTSDLETEVDTPFGVVVDNFRPYVEKVRLTDVRTGRGALSRGLGLRSDRRRAPVRGAGWGGRARLRRRRAAPDRHLQRAGPGGAYRGDRASRVGFLPRLHSRQAPERKRVWTARMPGRALRTPDAGLHRLRISARRPGRDDARPARGDEHPAGPVPQACELRPDRGPDGRRGVHQIPLR